MPALSTAVKSKRLQQAKILIEMGVDVNARDSATKRTALMELCFLEEEAKAAKLARILLDNGARVGIRDADGMTALCYAAKLGREQLVSAMMEETHSFDPNAADKLGNTALHYSAMSGNFVVLNLLLRTLNRFKLSVDMPNKAGETPLICASKSGNFLCARILVSEGKASQNARDKIFFKTASEWERTKESLRSASKSPLFRSLQLPSRSESPRNSNREEDEDSGLNTRPRTAPQRTARNKETNHRELLRKLFQVYEREVSSAFRRGAQPKLVVVKPPSSPSETMSQDSEFSEFGDSYSSGINSPLGSSSHRLSISRASNLASSANNAFRRRSIATAGLGLGTTNSGRRLSANSGRRSSQSMTPPKIRRGSINVIGKLNLNLQVAKRNSLEKGASKGRRSSVDTQSKALPPTGDKESPQSRGPDTSQSRGVSGSRSRTPSKPAFSNLQTLAEGSNDEEEEEKGDILQRSSPAALCQ